MSLIFDTETADGCVNEGLLWIDGLMSDRFLTKEQYASYLDQAIECLSKAGNILMESVSQ